MLPQKTCVTSYIYLTFKRVIKIKKFEIPNLTCVVRGGIGVQNVEDFKAPKVISRPINFTTYHFNNGAYRR